jgi:hypothetical protein
MRGETPMSYDPYASGSEMPPEYGPVAQPGDANQARKRVQAPAIALIVIGVLNLLLAAGPALYGIGAASLQPAQLEEAMRAQNPKALEDAKAQGLSITQIRNMLVYGSLSLAGADFFASFLVIVGGIRMLSLKSYGLAIVASILAAVPGFSCSGCCGFGAVIGIWALIVLINADVREAFQ